MTEKYLGGKYVGQDDNWVYYEECPDPVGFWVWLSIVGVCALLLYVCYLFDARVGS